MKDKYRRKIFRFGGWGEFMKFLAPLVVLLLDNDELHQDDLKKRTNSSVPYLLYSSFFYEYTSRALMG